MIKNKKQIVTIYEDPITRLKPEGKAQLIELLREDTGDRLELWEVEFLDEPGTTYTRTLVAIKKI